MPIMVFWLFISWTFLSLAFCGPCAEDGYFDWIGDQFGERCTRKWLGNDLASLEQSLKDKLYGQHLVTRAVSATIRGHLENEDPPKALALSFHGWTGVGKTFVSNIIASSLYTNGLKSKFVKRFYGVVDFPDEQMTDSYKKIIQRSVSDCVSECCQCLFIFDEVDKMPPGVFDPIKAYLDHYENVHEVDYRRSIFIFISNLGAERISDITLKHWQDGKDREELQLNDVQPFLRKAVYNLDGGLKHSALVEHNLLGIFIPFLPLERRHVKQCITSHMKHNYAEDRINRVADELNYYPEDSKLFAKTGCSGVNEKVYLIDMY